MQKAAIVYIVSSNPERQREFYVSLRRLDRHFNNRYHYPVIVFHEEDFSDQLKMQVLRNTKSSVTFAPVSFVYDRPHNQEFRIGYCNMCRFFAGQVQDHPALRGLDWFMRCDTDSLLLRDINYDVFDYMDSNNYLYGYITIVQDAIYTTVDLWRTVERYIKENDVVPVNTISERSWDRKAFYTNFEIVKLSFLRSNNYRNFFNYLDTADGYFMHRWGDHVTRYLAVQLFVEDKLIHKFQDIWFQHLPFIQAGRMSRYMRILWQKVWRRLKRLQNNIV